MWQGDWNVPLQDRVLWTDRQAMDCTLQGLEGVISYLDDILIVTKGDIQEHNELVERVMQRLDAEGWALKLSKCEFSVNQITWLGYDINENGYSPKFSKIEAIQSYKTTANSKTTSVIHGNVKSFTKVYP